MKKLINAQRTQDAQASGQGKSDAAHVNHFAKAKGLITKTENNISALEKDEPEWQALISEGSQIGTLTGDQLAVAQEKMLSAKTKIAELKQIFSETIEAIASAKATAGVTHNPKVASSNPAPATKDESRSVQLNSKL